MVLRVDKFLSNMGFESRKGVRKILKAGLVTVDGIIVKDQALKVDTQKNLIKVDGETVEYQKYVYLMMNKPAGLISATEDEDGETVLDILPEEFAFFAPFPVGRLDKDAEGLLLLTNDGNFAHKTLSPKKHVQKEYVAEVAPPPTKEDAALFEKGVQLDGGYVCKPALLENVGEKFVKITLTEGKFHQIKRMFEAVGKKVVYLKRVRFGGIALDESLSAGECRQLNEEEMQIIEKYISKEDMK